MTGYTNLVQGPAVGLPRLAKPFRQADFAARIAELIDAGRLRDNVVPIPEAGRSQKGSTG
jgi:hypothetical protein